MNPSELFKLEKNRLEEKYEDVKILRAKPSDLPSELTAKADNYIPPVDMHLFIAIVWDDVIIGSVDVENLSLLLSKFLDSV